MNIETGIGRRILKPSPFKCVFGNETESCDKESKLNL